MPVLPKGSRIILDSMNMSKRLLVAVRFIAQLTHPKPLSSGEYCRINPTATILLVIFAVQAITSYVRMSPTFDESTHISAGFSYVKSNNYSLNFEHPPLIKQIAAIPLLFMPIGLPEDYIGWKEKKIAPFSHFSWTVSCLEVLFHNDFPNNSVYIFNNI